jgi:hypothetical protein
MNQENLPKKLQALVEMVDIANLLTDPLTQSIEHFLRISAAEMDSDEASVLIRDGDEGDLRFLSAVGKVADQLINLKVPAGKGIAGFVMSSGQPMAVADAGEEQTFYAEVDKKTGYSTQLILATPLRHNGEVIGVLEYINRINNLRRTRWTKPRFAPTQSPRLSTLTNQPNFCTISVKKLSTMILKLTLPKSANGCIIFVMRQAIKKCSIWRFCCVSFQVAVTRKDKCAGNCLNQFCTIPIRKMKRVF